MDIHIQNVHLISGCKVHFKFSERFKNVFIFYRRLLPLIASGKGKLGEPSQEDFSLYILSYSLRSEPCNYITYSKINFKKTNTLKNVAGYQCIW